MAWIESVEADGLEATRRVPGFHDEPLKGKQRGQRSIRLSRQWRAIYEIRTDGGAELVSAEEVTPHEYGDEKSQTHAQQVGCDGLS